MLTAVQTIPLNEDSWNDLKIENTKSPKVKVINIAVMTKMVCLPYLQKQHKCFVDYVSLDMGHLA